MNAARALATGTGDQRDRAMRTRIAVVNSHPVQYFAPLYAYLSKETDLDITVLYCTDYSLRESWTTGFGHSFTWDVDLLEGYRSRYLGKRAHSRVPGGFLSLIVPEIWKEIRSGAYDVIVVHGHRHAFCWLAILAAKLSGVRVFMRCETHLGLERSRWVRKFRHLVIGSLYRSCDHALAIGSANAEFYRDLGMPDEKISIVPYSVDNDRFEAASRLDRDQWEFERAALGLPFDRPVVLYASKFQARKRPQDVVRAAARMVEDGVEFSLLMVGDGEMHGELRGLVAELKLENVVFGGFVNQSRLPIVYGISDVFVLPSENEPWGLVVNEVMCAGLPLVLTEEIGCVPDLVAAGDNGFVYRAGDVEALAKALDRLLSDEGLRKAMGEQSRARVGRWSYREYLVGLRQAIGRV